MHDLRVNHLNMIQGVINRLANQATAMKGFAFAAVGSELYRHQGYDALLYFGAGAVVVAYFLVRLYVRVNL